MKTKNAEMLKLRQEITRLKVRLNELDGDYEPTSVSCGHDVVLAHLKKLMEQHELPGLCQIAGADKKHGWYTTNIVPEKIRVSLESADVLREFLAPFCLPGVWEALAGAYHGELAAGDPGTDTLAREGLLQGDKLTVDGFTCYAVLGHLAYNAKKKLAIPKAIEIFKLAYKLTGLEFGEFLPYSEQEFFELLRDHSGYAALVAKGISEEDIKTYIRQNNR